MKKQKICSELMEATAENGANSGVDGEVKAHLLEEQVTKWKGRCWETLLLLSHLQ